MSLLQPSVALTVNCSTVGDDDFGYVPGELTLTITPGVMAHLVRLMAYQEQVAELFASSFPDGPSDWYGVEIMFPYFEPTCLLDEDSEEGAELGDADEEEGADMRIDCKSIQLTQSGVVLLANMRNSSTKLLSDEICFEALRGKFIELRVIMRSIATQEAVAGAIGDAEPASSPSASRVSKGMSL